MASAPPPLATDATPERDPATPSRGESSFALPSASVPLAPALSRQTAKVYRQLAWRTLLPGAIALSDALLVALVFLGCYMARFEWGILPPAAPPPEFGPYVHASVLVAVVWTACLAWTGLYRVARRPASRFDDAVMLVGGLTLGAGATMALSFAYRSFSYSRLVAIYALILSVLLLGAYHLLLRRVQAWALGHGIGVRRTLILGTNPHAIELARRLVAEPKWGRAIVGLVRLPGDVSAPGVASVAALGALPALPAILGTEAEIPALVAALPLDEVLVAWPDAPASQLVALLQSVGALRDDLEVQVAPDLAGMLTARLETTSLAGLPLLTLRPVALRSPLNRALKRASDVALAAIALLLLAPLLGAIALLVRLESPGPAFYAQERLGRDGRRFTIYKFRTMQTDAEQHGPVWTKQGDGRATRLGAFLRRYSLDELPQLWNILQGDMSLVGPRPERPHFASQFQADIPRYMDRHLARCGLTGWAQVNGLRGDVSIESRTRYDLWYVENWSLLLDWRIMAMTLAEIVRRPAY